MELTYDWKGFQNFFYSRKRVANSNAVVPIYLVVDGRAIVTVFSDGEDLSDWVGSTCDELIAELPHREVILYDREKVDQWLASSVDVVHFYDQIQYLSQEAKPQGMSKSRHKNALQAVNKHFLLSLTRGGWARLFPSTYGIYIRLDHGQGNSLFLVFQRGKLQTFHIPDLSGMISDRRKNPEDIVKFLSERYLMPVQGLFLNTSEWVEWSELANPWPKIAACLKRHREKFVPFRWSLAFLITLKGHLGL